MRKLRNAVQIVRYFAGEYSRLRERPRFYNRRESLRMAWTGTRHDMYHDKDGKRWRFLSRTRYNNASGLYDFLPDLPWEYWEL